ncbi:hypothetical protein [Pseudomonas sp. TMW22089]|uniref:hypothetical protein n=1 Tax=Pseudomonas sp. TMW22089 TaxID=2506433 RepID=UPI001F0EF9F2|nr:hypothetical protein [Pseudomonas sp. TMW22089]MCH4870672.1 hypothetical protein [Pseudomonas sp. TMW22089]
MRNIDLYGHAKVTKEFHERASYIARMSSAGEKSARSMAWDLFATDQLKIDDSNERTSNFAKLKYVEAIERLRPYGLVMDIDADTFARHFFDELCVINKKVTNKGVQIVFYVFVALALFGIYKLFL